MDQIRPELEQVLSNGLKVKMVIDLNSGITEPDTLKELVGWSRDSGNRFEFKAFLNGNPMFHAKLCIAHSAESTIFLTGSYNLTEKALGANLEHGLLVRCAGTEDISKEVLAAFEAYWKSPGAKVLSDDDVERYEETYKKGLASLENPEAWAEARQNLEPKYWIFKCKPNREGPTKGFNFEKLYNKNGPVSWGEVGQNDNTRKHIKQDIRKGHRVLFYHSSSKPSAVMGTAQVVQEFYSDPEYSPEPLVNIQAYQRFANPVTLDQIKQNTKLQDLYCKRLLRQSVVSIQPITRKEYAEIVRMGMGEQNP